jgi:hypothetical protein
VGARLLTPRLLHTSLAGPLALALLAGCRRYDDESARLRAEQAVLTRQVHGLRELVALAERGSLLPRDAFAIAVDEALVRDLLAAGLPQEQVLSERYRVRVERAEVAFRSQQSLVTLHGRVTSLQAPDTYVDVVLRGGLGTLAVDARSRRLRATVALDHVEVQQAAAGGARSGAVGALVEELGRERLEAFAALVPPLEIPVQLEERLVLRGTGDEHVRVRAGELPLRVAVTRVIPLSGRLWVLLELTAGPWRVLDGAPPEGRR